ncbi:hypothetical protein [Tropicimonas sp. IMCC6043]|uniref:hypothetical protein n=1 Tax=Tropicimonas sp. IMCC6043 TaxID=2510645 RepID=UPI00101DCF74|nr:hypothetical protein [Tropicimonas sp. IMCC6043]RYH09981.1 hypothetical protein EU800_10560 [Tropicimonas sp. IMCC6043]
MTGAALLKCRLVGAGVLFFVWLAAAIAAVGETAPPHGLAWNRSGLPAVFPLQVQTDPGRAFRLTLRQVDTDEAVLAADIEGGRFFRVLVPPGVFRLQFEYGNLWQGEAARFGSGAETGIFTLPDTLTFEILGSATRIGHIVDLTGFSPDRPPAPDIRQQRICQGLRYEPERRAPVRSGAMHDRESLRDAWRLSRNPLDLIRENPAGLDDLTPPYDFRPEIQSRYCE